MRFDPTGRVQGWNSDSIDFNPWTLRPVPFISAFPNPHPNNSPFLKSAIARSSVLCLPRRSRQAKTGHLYYDTLLCQKLTWDCIAKLFLLWYWAIIFQGNWKWGFISAFSCIAFLPDEFTRHQFLKAKRSCNILIIANYHNNMVTRTLLAQILKLGHTRLPIYETIATSDWRVKQRETLQPAYNQDLKTCWGNDPPGRPGRRW